MSGKQNIPDASDDDEQRGRSRFSAGWDSTLNASGRRRFDEWTNASEPPLLADGTNAKVAQNVLNSEDAAAMRDALYEAFYPILEVGDRAIPEEAMEEVAETGTDRLPKSYHLKGCLLDDEDSEAYERARDVGLIEYLESERLLRLAEGASGHDLRGPVGLELLCYEHGDYTGPHTDHHPDDPNRKDGYVDVHVTLCNSYVDQQLLVSESDGHLDQQHDVGVESAVSLSWLPHWHYTTPLVGKPGHEEDARRWLLLATYELE